MEFFSGGSGLFKMNAAVVEKVHESLLLYASDIRFVHVTELTAIFIILFLISSF